MGKLKVVLLVGILGTLLLSVGAVLADTGTDFTFEGVAESSCSPGHNLSFDFVFSVPEGDFDAYHDWTVTNLRNGNSNSDDNVGPLPIGANQEISDSGGDIEVPAGTKSGDTLRVTVIATSGVDGGDSDSITFVCGTTSSKHRGKGKPFNPGDARLNHDDAGASYSVYCQTNGDISVWAIAKDGHSFETFVATAAKIAAVSATPETATAIDSGAGGDGGVITLYRRPDGYFQLNGPALAPNNLSKTYIVAFNGCPATDVKTWES